MSGCRQGVLDSGGSVGQPGQVARGNATECMLATISSSALRASYVRSASHRGEILCSD